MRELLYCCVDLTPHIAAGGLHHMTGLLAGQAELETCYSLGDRVEARAVPGPVWPGPETRPRTAPAPSRNLGEGACPPFSWDKGHCPPPDRLCQLRLLHT